MFTVTFTCYVVAVGHAITKLLRNNEYQGQQLMGSFTEKCHKKRKISALVCLVILSSLGRAFVYTCLFSVRCCVWCSSLGPSGLLCFLCGTSGMDGPSSYASLACALHRDFSPERGPHLNSVSEPLCSVCWLLAQGLDLVVLKSDLSIGADLPSSLARDQETDS